MDLVDPAVSMSRWLKKHQRSQALRSSNFVKLCQVAFFESAAFRRILRSDSPPFSSIFIHFPGLPETKVDIEKKAPFLGLAVLGLSRRVRRGWTLL